METSVLFAPSCSIVSLSGTGAVSQELTSSSIRFGVRAEGMSGAVFASTNKFELWGLKCFCNLIILDINGLVPLNELLIHGSLEGPKLNMQKECIAIIGNWLSVPRPGQRMAAAWLLPTPRREFLVGRNTDQTTVYRLLYSAASLSGMFWAASTCLVPNSLRATCGGRLAFGTALAFLLGMQLRTAVF
jgi:hypothetical protein